MAPAANHRRNGGRDNQSTASPYRLSHTMGRGVATIQNAGS
jgi:hypothetical protein